MNETAQKIAQDCLDTAYNMTRSFPEIVSTLIQHGFEGYHIDYMRERAIYFLNDDTSFDLPLHKLEAGVAKKFDIAAVQTAIKEAQQNSEGYTYVGFCKKIMHAGCAGYIVSFLGKRVLYYGRDAETHIEHFPQS